MVKAADFLDLLVGQLEIKDVDVFGDVLKAVSLRDNHMAAADSPVQHDLDY